MSPPSRIEMREADRPLAVDVEQRLRRIDEAAADVGDVAEPDRPAAGDQRDVEDVGLGLEGAGDPQGQVLQPGVDRARRPHDVLRGDRRRRSGA